MKMQELNNELLLNFIEYYKTKNNGIYEFGEEIENLNKHFTLEEFNYIKKNIESIKSELNYNQYNSLKTKLLFYTYKEEINGVVEDDKKIDYIIENLQLLPGKEDTIGIFNDWDFNNGELTFSSYCKVKGLDYGNTYKKYVKIFGLTNIKIKIAKINLKYWESLVD